MFHGGSRLLNFEKSRNILKITNKPKIDPKIVQMCFEHVLGRYFWKFFAQLSMEGRVFEKFKKIKKFQSSKIAQKSSQKYPNAFWTCFGAIFSKKFLPSFPWRVESSKITKKKPRIFKVPKKTKIVTKSVQTCFEHVSGQIFPKKIFAQCSMKARDFETFQKNQKKFKIPKKAKIVPKRIQTCFERACFAASFSNKSSSQCSMEARDF